MSGLAVAVGALILVAVLIIGLLAIPVRLSLTVRRTERLTTEMRFGWLFGLVDASPSRRQTTRRDESNDGPPAVGSRRRQRGPRVARVVAVLRSRGFVARLARLVRDLVRRARVERVALQARFGLGDPADTGQVYGMLMPILTSANAAGLDLRCEPDFDDAVLNGTLTARVRVVPLFIVASATRFLCSPAVIRAAMTWRRHR